MGPAGIVCSVVSNLTAKRLSVGCEEFRREVSLHAIREDGAAEAAGDLFGGAETQAGAGADGEASADEFAGPVNRGVILDFDDLEAGDEGGAKNFGNVVDDAGDAGAEATAFEIANGFAGEGLGEDRDDAATGIAHTVVEADEGAAGADAADDGGDVATGDLVYDLAGRSHAVGECVVEVFELAGEEDVVALTEAFDFGKGTADAVGFRSEHDVAAIAADHHGAFSADAFEHDGGEAEAELGADEGHGNGGGAAGRFDDEGAGLDAFFAEGFFENEAGDAVLRGAAGV